MYSRRGSIYCRPWSQDDSELWYIIHNGSRFTHILNYLRFCISAPVRPYNRPPLLPHQEYQILASTILRHPARSLFDAYAIYSRCQSTSSVSRLTSVSSPKICYVFSAVPHYLLCLLTISSIKIPSLTSISLVHSGNTVYYQIYS